MNAKDLRELREKMDPEVRAGNISAAHADEAIDWLVTWGANAMETLPPAIGGVQKMAEIAIAVAYLAGFMQACSVQRTRAKAIGLRN